MPQSTGLVQITSTWIQSNNTPIQVVNSGTALELCMSMTIDQSLIGNGYRFDVNYQILEFTTGHIQSNTWLSEGRYPIFVDHWFSGGGGDYTWLQENEANNFGIHDGSGNSAESQGSGMYSLRVFIFIDACEYSADGSLYRFSGNSQWAVADDLYFWCE